MIPGSVRVGLGWLLVLTFLIFATPTTASILVGAAAALVGLVVRAWAAGTIDKGAELGTGGPYAYTRNPLYLGSFVIGLAFGVAGGHWMWPLAFSVFFLAVYMPTMRQEARELTERFGDRYRDYAARVPTFVPSLTPRHADPQGGGSDFAWSRYRRYREWEATLGVVATLIALALKARFFA